MLTLSKEFIDGWKHFCNCVDFGKSCLDAEAIRFMNETPSKVIKALDCHNDLLAACEYVIEQLRDVKGKTFPIMPILEAIAKAKEIR